MVSHMLLEMVPRDPYKNVLFFFNDDPREQELSFLCWFSD